MSSEMWDLAGNGSSRQAPAGTESCSRETCGNRQTLGWADDFRGSSLPCSLRGSKFMEAADRSYTSGTTFQFPNWKLSPTISPCKARTLRFS